MITRLRGYIEQQRGDTSELDNVTAKNRQLFLGKDDKSPFLRITMQGQIPIVCSDSYADDVEGTVCLCCIELYGYLPDSPKSGHIRTIVRGKPLLEKLYVTVDAPRWTTIPTNLLKLIAEVLQEKYPHLL